jgi:hypothetical protein
LRFPRKRAKPDIVEVTVNSMEENSTDFCPSYIQEFGLSDRYYKREEKKEKQFLWTDVNGEEKYVHPTNLSRGISGSRDIILYSMYINGPSNPRITANIRITAVM